MLARHAVTVYDVMPAPPAIWRLPGLDRNRLSAI